MVCIYVFLQYHNRSKLRLNRGNNNYHHFEYLELIVMKKGDLICDPALSSVTS